MVNGHDFNRPGTDPIGEEDPEPYEPPHIGFEKNDDGGEITRGGVVVLVTLFLVIGALASLLIIYGFGEARDNKILDCVKAGQSASACHDAFK